MRTVLRGKVYKVAHFSKLGGNMETTTLTTQCDSKGRLYLRQSTRARYGKRFVIVEAPDEIVLLPVPDDPVKELARLGKPLKRYTIAQLKAAIRKRALEEALS